MSLDTGVVVWHKAPFKTTGADDTNPGRPLLTVSNESNPSH